MGKVIQMKVKSYIGVRNDASCIQCGWYAESLETASMRVEIKRHLKDHPSHTVARTFGSEFIYSVEDKEK